MEPQVIDYYNDMPLGVNVIDKMNEELAELQDKYEEINKIVNKYRIPCFKVKNVEEYNRKTEQIGAFSEKIKEIIMDESKGLIATHNLMERPQHNAYEWIKYVCDTYSHWYPGEKSMITKMIDGLDDLTENKNKEWASYRINYSLKKILSVYSRGPAVIYEQPNSQSEDLRNDIEEICDSIIEYILVGDGNMTFDPEAPELFCNFIPPKDDAEYAQNLYNALSFYNCEKCNVISCYGEPENYGNRLLCVDCLDDEN